MKEICGSMVTKLAICRECRHEIEIVGTDNEAAIRMTAGQRAIITTGLFRTRTKVENS